MRRGGNSYYSIDVTDKTSPNLLWSKSVTASGESWSTPIVARMDIGSHILDLKTGAELWRAGSDTAANLTLSGMTRAIPNTVRVIDLSGDGLADRMYASDMGGQIWRFDVINGEAPTELVTGGVIAQLHDASTMRRTSRW